MLRQYITANDLEVMESILFMEVKWALRFPVFLLAKFGCIWNGSKYNLFYSCW